MTVPSWLGKGILDSWSVKTMPPNEMARPRGNDPPGLTGLGMTGKVCFFAKK